jgi:uncharacterized protein YkwD
MTVLPTINNTRLSVALAFVSGSIFVAAAAYNFLPAGSQPALQLVSNSSAAGSVSIVPHPADLVHDAGTPLSAYLLTLINNDRAKNGLPPLRGSSKLRHVALLHSEDMATHGYLSHFTLSGRSPYDRLRQFGVRYQQAGENIGIDAGTDQHALLQSIEQAMLQSPEHRANLLRPAFTRVGIGIAVTGDTIYVTEDFKS